MISHCLFFCSFKTLRYNHTNICSAVCFRPGKRWELVSGGLDCRLVHWDFSKPKCLNQFNTQELFAIPGDSSYMVNPPFVHHVSCSPSGATFACALENGRIPLFDGSEKTLRPKHTLHGHSQGVSQVHFLDEDSCVSAGNDCNIVHWDLSRAQLYQPGEVHANGDSTDAGLISLEEEKNSTITDLCKVNSYSHPYKVNWISVFVSENERNIFVADQTADISILTI